MPLLHHARGDLTSFLQHSQAISLSDMRTLPCLNDVNAYRAFIFSNDSFSAARIPMGTAGDTIERPSRCVYNTSKTQSHQRSNTTKTPSRCAYNPSKTRAASAGNTTKHQAAAQTIPPEHRAARRQYRQNTKPKYEGTREQSHLQSPVTTLRYVT